MTIRPPFLLVKSGNVPAVTKAICVYVGVASSKVTPKFGVFPSLAIKSINNLVQVKIGDWLAIIYDDEWWVHIVDSVFEENEDLSARFLHPSKSRTIKFPVKDDKCWLPMTSVMDKSPAIAISSPK
uniref:Uncharacterized protein n=1 Tax=Romanomermis culicivorax TaxID=13658 RepID=A0A915IAC1_ROMCU